jgi:hypothetical protein
MASNSLNELAGGVARTKYLAASISADAALRRPLAVSFDTRLAKPKFSV